MEEKEFHLLDYWRIILKHRWTIAAFFTVIVVVVTVGSFLTEPVYRATAQILIERESPKVLGLPEVMNLNTADKDYYQTQYEMLKSRSLAERTVTALDLIHHPEFARKEKKTSEDAPANKTPADSLTAPTWLLNAFLNRVIIEPVKNSRLVNVGFEAKDPALAARSANTLAEQYIRQNLDLHSRLSQQASEWLWQEIRDQRKKLEESESALQNYKVTQGIIAIEEKETITPQKLAELNTELISVQNQRVELETKCHQIDALIARNGSPESIPEVINNSFIQNLKAQESKLIQDRAELSSKFGPKHPQMIRLTSELETIQGQIKSEEDKIITSIRGQFQVAQAREKNLKGAFEAQKNEALDLSRKSVQYNILKREVDTNSQMYDRLMQRLRETSISEQIETTNIRIVDRAEEPKKPIRPKKQTNILLAALIGLSLGIGLAFFFEYLDTSIKSPDEIEKELNLPFLGTVPAIKLPGLGKKSTVDELVVLSHPHSNAAEAFRLIRTGIFLSTAERPPKTILITSSAPFEGKTLNAVNLALTMAQTESRTLIIDGDMRKPRVNKIFGIPVSPGLTDLLTSNLDPAQVVQATSDPHLDVITAGKTPPNPAELLGSERMRRILAVVSERYDRVIIDSPPLIAITDGVILSSITEGVILVVHAGRTGKELVYRSVKSLQDAGAKILGIVLNNLEFKDYPYSYYYPYRYYHRYYQTENPEVSAH
ncbi:MAG: polysaccharide biosynthesis tyrosine autokinase [bacterium]|nr:polysaccharide biosynthesis tyrosine autokinase [bacterium]